METIAGLEAIGSFVGYGPIPGIASVRWLEGDGSPGSVREVRNTAGSLHLEKVVVFEPHRRIEDLIYGVTSPFRFLVREARDTFEFIPNGNETRLVRTFRFTLTSLLCWPVAVPVLALFRRAIRRHHQVVAACLAC